MDAHALAGGNMDIMPLIQEMGEDVDLLTKSDEWLEQERRNKAIEYSKITKELELIMLAQRIKISLQQKNLVVVQQIVRDHKGEIEDILIRILNLPDAIAMLQGPTADYDAINTNLQFEAWDSDGYDIEAASSLRT